jgi:hypothetical protein
MEINNHQHQTNNNKQKPCYLCCRVQVLLLGSWGATSEKLLHDSLTAPEKTKIFNTHLNLETAQKKQLNHTNTTLQKKQERNK